MINQNSIASQQRKKKEFGISLIRKPFLYKLKVYNRLCDLHTHYMPKSKDTYDQFFFFKKYICKGRSNYTLMIIDHGKNLQL